MAQNIYRRATRAVFAAKRGRIQLIEWNELCPGHVRRRVFTRRAHIEQFDGSPSGQPPLEFTRSDRGYRL